MLLARVIVVSNGLASRGVERLASRRLKRVRKDGGAVYLYVVVAERWRPRAS